MHSGFREPVCGDARLLYQRERGGVVETTAGGYIISTSAVLPGGWDFRGWVDGEKNAGLQIEWGIGGWRE